MSSPITSTAAGPFTTPAPVPSSSTTTTRRPALHSAHPAIHVVIPSAQTLARIATPTTTAGHGHIAIARPELTPGHGHPAVLLPGRDSPATPTCLRMSARATRRSGLFSSAVEDDEDEDGAEDGHALVGNGALMPPMEHEEMLHAAEEGAHAVDADVDVSRAGPEGAGDASDDEGLAVFGAA